MTASNSSYDWSKMFEDPQFYGMLTQWLDHSKNPDGIKMMHDPNQDKLDQMKIDLLGNSPTRNLVDGLSMQALQSMNGFTPNIQYKSDYMKDQTALGGYHMPTFDLSKLSSMGALGGVHGTGASSQPITPNPMGGGGYGGGNDITAVQAGGDTKMRVPSMIGNTGGLINTPGAFDPNMQGRNGYQDPRQSFAPPPTQGGNVDIKDAWAKAKQYLADHPQLSGTLLKGGGTLLFQAIGLPGLLGTAFGNWLANHLSSGAGASTTSGTQLAGQYAGNQAAP